METLLTEQFGSSVLVHNTMSG